MVHIAVIFSGTLSVYNNQSNYLLGAVCYQALVGGMLGTQLPCWQLQKGGRLEKVNTSTSFLLQKAEGDLASYDVHSVLSAGLPAN